MEELITKENLDNISELLKKATNALCEITQNLWEVLLKQEYLVGLEHSLLAVCLLLLAGICIYAAKVCFKKDNCEPGIIIFGIATIACMAAAWNHGFKAVRCFWIPEYNIFISILNYVK